MASNTVSLHKGQKNPAKEIVEQDFPQGVLLATATKRAGAYMLDLIFIFGILFVATRGTFTTWLWSVDELQTSGHIILLHWIILFLVHWLYFKYTGVWMGRSLGQRWFRIALVHDDASPLGRAHWGRRSIRKIIYILPIIGPLWFGIRDLYRISNDEKHQSRIDLLEHTVAAVDWSLPTDTRAKLR